MSLKSRATFKYFLIFIFLTAVTPSAQGEEAEPEKGKIIFKIEGLINTKGYLGLLLFNSSRGFPSDKEKAFRAYYTAFSSTAPEVTMEGLPYGKYAASVLHDENMNKKLDTNWLGIPREGIGVSNNTSGFRGRPRFKNSLFKLNKSSAVKNIKMRYMGR